MKLSKFFSLEEFTRSDTARKLGISNEPTPEHVQNLSDMCINLLDPIREAWGGPLYVSSGYRGFYLTKHIKGASKTSAHDYGLAADLVPVDTRDIDEFKAFVPKFLKKSGLPYDQWIDEERTTMVKGVAQVSRWGHIGYKDRKGRQRRQNLITNDGKTYQPLP